MTDTRPSSAEGNTARAGLDRLARSTIRLWALLGGMLLAVLVLVTAYSATMNLLFRAPFPGDFEVVEMGVAVAISAFLPYCQLTYANVTVDIFTAWAGPRLIAAMSVLASLVAIAIAILLLWRMYFGMRSYIDYQEYTAVLGIPLWFAFPPFLFSLVLLIVAALISLGESISSLRTGRLSPNIQAP